MQGKTLRTACTGRAAGIATVGTLAILGALLSPVGCTSRARVRVEGLQNGQPLRVPASRTARIEALSLGLLEASTYENNETVANSEMWSQYETQAHVAITFEPPRDVRVRRETFAISELLIPILVEHPPPHILVRTGGHIRAFCKFDCQAGTDLQAELGK